MNNAWLVWSSVIVLPVIWGIFCAYTLKHRYAIFIAGFVPWLALLLCLLLTVYILPNENHDASMWLVVQLFAGTIMASLGIAAYQLCIRYLQKSIK